MQVEDPAHFAPRSSDMQPDALQIVPYMPPEPVTTQLQRWPSDNGLQIVPYMPPEPVAAPPKCTPSPIGMPWNPFLKKRRFGAQVSSTYA